MTLSSGFLRTHKQTILGLVFGLAFSATLAYAVPPGSQYNPAETLDPGCAPGDTNCSVDISGTGGVWGSITGTLSDQTDLQNALDDKFDDPTGTTAQYIRGDGSLATSPINYVDNSYIGETSGPNGDGSSGGGNNNNIFLGDNAGSSLIDVTGSTFIGTDAGSAAQYAGRSTFIGQDAGLAVASSSTYDGPNTGVYFGSNFIGYQAGFSADNSTKATFIGYQAGASATNAANSIFIGTNAGGSPSSTPSNSIFIGTNAGYQDSVDNSGNPDNSSILIGAYTNTQGATNSILLGSGTSGAPIQNTANNQFMLADTITNVRWRGVEYQLPSAQGGAGEVLINDGTGGLGWGNSAGITLQTNTTTNGSQAILNLLAGNNITLIDNGSGGVTINGTTAPTTLYTGDGTISGSRTVDLAGNDLNFSDSGSGDKVGLYIDTGGLISSLGSAHTTGNTNLQVDNNANKVIVEGGTFNVANLATGGSPLMVTVDSVGDFSTAAVPTGTVTSVGVSGSGALSFTGSPVTSSGTISASWGGTTSQYVRGDGSLATLYTGSTSQYVRGDGSLATFSPSGLALETNSVANGSQTLLNLIAGTNVSLTDNGSGNVTITDTSPITIQNSSSLFSTGIFAGTSSFASDALFLGSGAGYCLTVSCGQLQSVFLGTLAGGAANTATNSVFIGYRTGNYATNSYSSVFIGNGAGRENNGAGNQGSAKAANSIFIGEFAGYKPGDAGLDNTTNANDYSILLGNNTSTGGFENSIALGQVATNTASNQFMIGSTTRPIDTTRIIGSAGTQCTITTGTGIACTSDERLKTGITDLSPTTLNTLLNVKTVTYHWLQNPDSPEQVGFLAQDLEQYFPDLVATDSDGYKSVYYAQMTPILVEAIREMNVKITDIANLDVDNSWRTALINWFGSTTNGIAKLFAGEVTTKKLCVADDSGATTCITKGQLDTLLGTTQTTGPVTQTPEVQPEVVTPAPDPAPLPTETIPTPDQSVTPIPDAASVVDPTPAPAPETPAQ